MTRHASKIATFLLAIIVVCLMFLGYEKFFDGTIIDPVEKINMPQAEISYGTEYFTPMPQGQVLGIYQVSTDKNSYKPGEEILVSLSLCHNRRITPTVRWSFINDIAAALPARSGNITEIGCYKNIRVPIGRLPDEFSAALPSSKYQLHGTVDFQVNPIRKVSYLVVSNFFTVEK